MMRRADFSNNHHATLDVFSSTMGIYVYKWICPLYTDCVEFWTLAWCLCTWDFRVYPALDMMSVPGILRHARYMHALFLCSFFCVHPRLGAKVLSACKSGVRHFKMRPLDIVNSCLPIIDSICDVAQMIKELLNKNDAMFFLSEWRKMIA